MSKLLLTVLFYDGKFLSEEHRIYEQSGEGFQLERLEILYVPPTPKKRNTKRKQKELTKVA